MREEIDKNMETEGSVFSGKWQKLNPKYRNQKSKRFGSKKILQATGAMKNSFMSKFSRNKVEISNKAPYFKYHQSNKPRRKLPRRVMMEIGRKQQAEILRFFTKYLNKITR